MIRLLALLLAGLVVLPCFMLGVVVTGIFVSPVEALLRRMRGPRVYLADRRSKRTKPMRSARVA